MTIEQLKEELIDILDESFPKGKCKERGQAMVMLGKILILIGKNPPVNDNKK